MSDISPSSIKVTKSLEEQLQGVTNSEQIKEIMKSAAIDQNLAHREWDESIVTPNEPGTAPRAFAKTIIVNGVKKILEASDEAGLLAQENALYRQAMQPAPIQQIEQPARDASTGRFTSPAEPSVSDEKKAELSLKFQLGQISASEYLEQSGAVAEYLEKQGVPLTDLKEAVAEKQGKKFEQSWADATSSFLNNSPEGRNWPGGEANMLAIGEVIQSQGWTDAEDKQAALEAAAKYLRENNLLVMPPEVAAHAREVEAHARIAGAKSVEEIRQAGSSLFGR
jgi:hypothetical protein